MAVGSEKEPDQIIDAVMAQGFIPTRAGPARAWIVMKDPPEYPGKVVERPVTDAPPHTFWWPTR
jgi:hypothetical protein